MLEGWKEPETRAEMSHRGGVLGRRGVVGSEQGQIHVSREDRSWHGGLVLQAQMLKGARMEKALRGRLSSW